jgi:hypothetical protein
MHPSRHDDQHVHSVNTEYHHQHFPSDLSSHVHQVTITLGLPFPPRSKSRSQISDPLTEPAGSCRMRHLTQASRFADSGLVPAVRWGYDPFFAHGGRVHPYDAAPSRDMLLRMNSRKNQR